MFSAEFMYRCDQYHHRRRRHSHLSFWHEDRFAFIYHLPIFQMTKTNYWDHVFIQNERVFMSCM